MKTDLNSNIKPDCNRITTGIADCADNHPVILGQRKSVVTLVKLMLDAVGANDQVKEKFITLAEKIDNAFNRVTQGFLHQIKINKEQEKRIEELEKLVDASNSEEIENLRNENENQQKMLNGHVQFNQRQVQILNMKDKNIEALRGIVSSTDERSQKQAKELKKRQEKLNSQAAELKEVKVSHASLSTKCDQLKEKLDTVSADKEADAALVTSLKKQLDKAEQEKKEAQNVHSKLSDEITRNQKQIFNLREELALSQASLLGATFEAKELEKQVSDLRYSNAYLNKITSVFISQIEMNERENEKLKKEIEELKRQQAETQVHTDRKVELDYETLRGIKSNRRTVVEHQAKELELKQNSLHMLFEKGESEITNQRNDVENLYRQQVELKKSIKDQRQNLEHEKQISLEEIGKAKNKLEELENMRSELDARSEISERLILKAQVHLIKVEKEIIQLTDRIRSIEVEFSMELRNLNNLRETMSKSGIASDDEMYEYTTAKQVVEKLESLLQKLKETVQKKEASEKRLQEEIKGLQSEDDEALSTLDREIQNQLELKLFHKEKVEQLEEDMEMLVERLSETKAEIKRLAEEAEDLSVEAESIREDRVLSERRLRGEQADLNAQKEVLNAPKKVVKSFFEILLSPITG